MVIRKSIKDKKQFWSKQGNRVTERTARIEHQCSECGEDINIGDKYREITGDDSWNHYTLRKCKNCWDNKNTNEEDD